MAKQLYDYWFVQFDFPNEEGKPYKSSGGVMVWNEKLKREIPKGWHCGTLLDIAEYTNGLACQKYRPTDDNKLPVIKIKEMHDGLSVDTEWVKADIPDEVKVFDGDVLFSWSASLEVMLWAYGNGGLNQHIFKVTSKNGYPRSFYFYQLIHYIGVFKQMAEARKTTMGHITQDHLRQSSIVLPPDVDITNKLEEKLCPIFDAIVKNSQEIMTLTKQRDELLPLLMNGQASVNYHLSVVNVVARLPFYRRLPIFMYCFILLLLSRLSWYNKNVRLQEMGDVVKGVIKKLSENGSPRATIETDEERTFFLIDIPCNPDCLGGPILKGDMKDDMKGDMKGDMKNLSDIQKVIVSSELDNNKMTIPELARKTGMSVSKINREIRILRDDFHVYFKMLSHSH